MSIRSRNSSLLITCSLQSSLPFPRQKKVYTLPHERFPTVEAACLLKRCNVHSKPKYTAMSIRSRNSSLLITCSLTSSLPFPHRKKVYSLPHERFPTVESACLLKHCNVHSNPKYAAMSIRSRNSSLLITCSLQSSLPFPRQKKVYSLPYERFQTVEAACLLKQCNVHSKPKYLLITALLRLLITSCSGLGEIEIYKIADRWSQVLRVAADLPFIFPLSLSLSLSFLCTEEKNVTSTDSVMFYIYCLSVVATALSCPLEDAMEILGLLLFSNIISS
ncbi:unnamed protein product [Acanthosepion pharaonis]|uniref:Uncharacterized protein n=1 Tax=Acanthosepion pharaonis TaxID=158019 RepID=A0A812E1Y1_ACAPH|nr:unnamed protein product [Sepia pharaonis]